jgi:hypothetical protein
LKNYTVPLEGLPGLKPELGAGRDHRKRRRQAALAADTIAKLVSKSLLAAEVPRADLEYRFLMPSRIRF